MKFKAFIVLFTCAASMAYAANCEKETIWRSTDLSWKLGVLLYSLGFTFFLTLSFGLQRYLDERRLPNGRYWRDLYDLNDVEVKDIANRLVSCTHAIISVVAGIIVYRLTSDQFVHAHSYFMECYCCFACSYFLADLVTMYDISKQTIKDRISMLSRKHFRKPYFFEPLEHFVTTNALMIVHHLFVGFYGLAVVLYLRGGGHCIGSFILMMELSTPFVSFHGIIRKLNLKHSRIYITNGIAMVITFFICRIIMWPYVIKRYSDYIDKSFFEAIIGLPPLCMVSILTLLLPQLYWFNLMVRGCIKQLTIIYRQHRD